MEQASVWVVDGIFDSETCDQYVADAEKNGWNRAALATTPPATRSTIWTHIDTDHLFRRIERTVAPTHGALTLLNIPPERVICARYDVGDSFSVHTDAPYMPSPDVSSGYSVIVYLNDHFDGGETHFPDLELSVSPRKGSALIFAHHIRHQGQAIRGGRKYILHTFVMYGAQ